MKEAYRVENFPSLHDNFLRDRLFLGQYSKTNLKSQQDIYNYLKDIKNFYLVVIGQEESQDSWLAVY